MLTIGLTGGIGTGKSVCADIFEALGVPIYVSDTKAKILMHQDHMIRRQVIELLGEKSYLPTGPLDRAYVATQVFSDGGLLAKLNAIVHPAVRADFHRWTRQQQAPYVIQESALLYEIGAETYFDQIVVVDAPLDVRIARVMERDQVDRASVMERIAKQLPQEEKVQRADHVIINDGQQALIRQILDLHLLWTL